jgi:hypothetical protein
MFASTCPTTLTGQDLLTGATPSPSTVAAETPGPWSPPAADTRNHDADTLTGRCVGFWAATPSRRLRGVRSQVRPPASVGNPVIVSREGT